MFVWDDPSQDQRSKITRDYAASRETMINPSSVPLMHHDDLDWVKGNWEIRMGLEFLYKFPEISLPTDGASNQ